MALLAYADDVVLMDKSHNGLRSLFNRLEEGSKKVRLQIIKDKIEYMVMEDAEIFPSLSSFLRCYMNRNFYYKLKQ